MRNSNKSKIQAIIAARYNKSLVATKRKNITFNINEELLERLDSIVNAFNEKDDNTTRNAIIEDAILAYIEEAEDFFEMQNVINDDISIVDNIAYDTAVFPALNVNFNEVFMGKHQWYYVRMAEHRVKNVKYIALYRGAPISAITHYAEVIDISDPNEENKRLIKLKEPIAFAQPIVLGNIHVNNVRKLFYTSLKKLESVNTVKDLLK